MSRKHSNFDVWLDTELAGVPVPVGMLERLRHIPLASDEQLDAAVRDLPVPRELDIRLRRIGRAGARWARLQQMAIASCLVLMIGGSYGGAMVAFLLSARGMPEPPPVRLISRVMVGVAEESELEGAEIASARRETPGHRALPPPPRRPVFQLAAYQGPSPDWPAEEARGRFVGLGHPRGSVWGTSGAGAVWPAFSAHYRPGESRESTLAPRLVRRGAAPPPLDDTGQAFLAQTGFNPFVSLGRHASRQISVVPLGQDTFSYDLMRQVLRRGEVPPPHMLRTEDFLAAIDYGFPLPRHRPVGLCVLGGPSPFSPTDGRLLQIGVRARDALRGDRPGTRLTLAVDVSAGMHESGGAEMVRRALGELAQHMGPKDHVSLVIFDDNAYVLAEQLGPSGMDELLAAVDPFAGKGARDVVAGLRQGYAVAYRQTRGAPAACRVVLLTDSGAHVEPFVARRIAEQLVATTASGIILHVINVGYSHGPEMPDPGLMDLARAGGGAVHRATNADEIGWVLGGIITGKSQLAACDVRLQVTFNPKTVSAYRLLGHEVGDIPAEPEADFRGGQTATALYEVELARGAERESEEIEEVALVELSWWDPASGQTDSVTHRFRRGQFAATMIEAPLPLQAAAVVAEAVEILRGSPFIGARSDPRSLTPVLERAVQVDSVLQRDPTFSEFVSTVEQAQAAALR